MGSNAQQLIDFLEGDSDYVEYTPENETDWQSDLDTKVIQLTEPQSEFITLEEQYLLFVAGFGSGKSTVLGLAILRDLRFYNGDVPIKIGCYCPTYDLLKLITIPYLCEFLEQSGIGYRLNRSDFIFYLDTGDQIIMRSLANPERIVGYETFRAHVDEIDTLPEKKAELSWNKIIARNRQKVYDYDSDGNVKEFENEDGEIEPLMLRNKVSAYTTPEGFKFCYKRFKKDPPDGYRFITASTRSNAKNLPPDYIPNLIKTYPPALIEAYIEGEFVNLTSGSVYPEFDRELNHTDEEIKPGESLECGMDFNVNNMSISVGVVRNNEPRVLDEIQGSRDTREACRALQERYPGHHVTIFPDASGKNTSSKSASESDLTIIKGFKFKIKNSRKNPFVKDRVISVNAQINNAEFVRKLKVNTNKCPNVTDCFEQQVYGPDGTPDKGSGNDHFPDCVGYWIFQKWPVKRSTKTYSSVRLMSR